MLKGKMKTLRNASYKELEIGQTIYNFEECGLDQSYIISPMTLDGFSVNKNGIYAFNASNEHYTCTNSSSLDKYYLSLDELVEFCKENDIPYSISN